jgi:hypothetical protein
LLAVALLFDAPAGFAVRGHETLRDSLRSSREGLRPGTVRGRKGTGQRKDTGEEQDVLVMTRYVVAAEEAEAFRAQCRAAVDALVACAGCTSAMAGPALDEPSTFEGLIRWTPEGGVQEGASAIAAECDDGEAR